MFKGKKEEPNKHCYGGSSDNVLIPITFEKYNKVRAASYKYEANKEEFSVVINDKVKI